jgi:hypothetical protein
VRRNGYNGIYLASRAWAATAREYSGNQEKEATTRKIIRNFSQLCFAPVSEEVNSCHRNLVAAKASKQSNPTDSGFARARAAPLLSSKF